MLYHTQRAEPLSLSSGSLEIGNERDVIADLRLYPIFERSDAERLAARTHAQRCKDIVDMKGAIPVPGPEERCCLFGAVRFARPYVPETLKAAVE